MRAGINSATRKLMARGESLNNYQSVVSFAGLGVLLLHAYLTAKSKRITFE
jgi:hypothetical protein